MTINLRRYTGVYLTAMFALIALSVVLDRMFGYNFPVGLTAIIPAMSAAQMEGMQYARKHRAPLENSAAWRAALAMTGIAFALQALLLIVQIAIPGVAQALTSVPRGFLFGIMAFVMLVVFLTNRVFLASGGRAEIKRQARASK